jgi:hypothetical protein
MTPGVRSGGSAQERLTPKPGNTSKMSEIDRIRGKREAQEKSVIARNSEEDGLRGLADNK